MSRCAPADCVLAFGIPHDHATFMRHLRAPDLHDFVPGQYRSWQKYRAEVATAIEDVVPRIEATGAKVVCALSFGDFAALFDNYRVIILFAHWRPTDNSVEFFDGLYSSERVAAAVPAWYNGVLDLCVCHPGPLTMAVKRVAPATRVKFSWLPAQPRRWLYLYLVLFTILKSEQIGYGDALASAMATITERSQ